MVKACLFENGKRQDLTLDKAQISALDAAYLFGDGIYEVIGVVNGQIFDLKPHMQRLEKSLATVLIEPPVPIKAIANELENLVDKNATGYLYLQISRGAHNKRDFAIHSETKPTFFGYFMEMKILPEPVDSETSIIFPDIRWNLRHVKTTQLMASRLARKCAAEVGALEPIFISPEGIITEGGASNIFVVKNKTISTHPADNDILWGITRSRVIELAKQEGYKISERKFKLDELLAADEVFRTSTTQGVRAIGSIKIIPLNEKIFAGVENIWQPQQLGEHKISTGKIGEITKTLATKYIALAQNQNTQNDKLTKTA